jgi:hypothetical protein
VKLICARNNEALTQCRDKGVTGWRRINRNEYTLLAS